MGGLCAIVRLDSAPIGREVLERMVEAAAHRASVGATYLLGDGVGMAALGLRSQELEGQPLSSPDGAVQLVADARLDARQELRLALVREGHEVSAAGGDAGLLLAAYLVWGEHCAGRLRGDFAFVVRDRRLGRVFCARDCFGIKPLHYRIEGACFYAASEAQQLVRGLRLHLQLDEVAVADYLMDDSRDEARTFFVGISRLPSASVLRLDASRRSVERYWRPQPPSSRRLSGPAVVEEVIYRLDRAVAERLPSGDPVVGLTMSGGLDSCSIAALAQRRLKATGSGALLALTYGFDTLTECDESRYSCAMAAELGIEVEPVDAESRWLLGDPQAFAPALEGPFQGWQSTDRHIFCRLRERGGRVLLTGFGGDNLFAGSSRVFLARLQRGDVSALADVWRVARRHDISLARAVYTYLVGPALPRLDLSLRRLLGRAGLLEVPPWIDRRFAARTGLRDRLARRDPQRTFRDPAREAHWRILCRLESVGRACSWLDRTAAEYGVEVRHPFLDRELAELVLRVDPAEHCGIEGRKLLLREAMRGLLPESVRLRPDKTRFATYIGSSLRREKSTINDLFEEPRLADLGFVDADALRRAWTAYAEGEAECMVRHIWYLVTLEIWLLQFGRESRSLGFDSATSH